MSGRNARRDASGAAAVIALAILFLASGPASAQTQANRLPQDTQREPVRPSGDVPLKIDRDLFASEIPPNAQSTRLTLASVELRGNLALSTDQLKALWADRLGQTISLADVFKLASQITAAYRNAGYVLSQAIVPEQQLDQRNARVVLQVAEGYIGKVLISGASDEARRRIDAMLQPVTREKPLTQATLERRLLLLNELPGVQARANLKSGSHMGAADMEVQVQQDPWAFSAAIHNRTSEAVGPVRMELSAERRGAFGAFDKHAVRLLSSGNQRLNLLAYSGDAPLGHDGLTVNWSLSTSKSKPKSGAIFQLDTDSSNASLGLSYPVLRSRRTNLAVRGSLFGYDGSTDVAAGVPLSKDKLRIARIGSSFDTLDTWGGINLLDVEFSKGLGVLGASREGDLLLQRSGSNPQFSKTTLYAARLQSLGGNWSALLAGTGQHSNDLLGSSEQFGIGGELFLRAYDPSELLGDSGAAGKFELRYNTALGSISLLGYGFFDTGVVTSNSTSAGNTSASAQSYGVGLRFGLPYSTRGFVELAKPRKRPTAAQGNLDPRVFAGLSIDF